MADVISVSFSANTGNLESALAMAQARVRAFGTEVRQLADQAANGNIGGGLEGQLETAAGALSMAKAEVSDLNTKLKETATGGFARFNEGVKSAVEPLTLLSSRMRETAEIAGITFALDKIREYISSMGELGEKTVNMAAAVGTTPHEFSLLSRALELAGSDSQTAARSLEQLGRNLQEALTVKSSQAAKAVASLGITQAQLKHASTDLGFALDLMGEKFAAFADSPAKTADFMALMGRGMQQLIPYLREGAGGMEDLKEKAEQTGAVLSNQEAAALADTGEKVHLLTVTLEGAGVRGFMSMKGAIDSAIDSLTNFVKWVGDAVSAATHLSGAEAQAEHFRQIRESAHGAPNGIGIFGSVGPAGRHNPSLNTNYVPPPFAQSGAREGAAPSGGNQDVSAAGKPEVAPWPAEGGGGHKRGGAEKGQADELETWREQLQQKLEAERNFFADSTAQELAFWQQKVNLTSAGSKERAQVESTIYALQKRQAVEAERDQEQSIAAQMRVSDAVYERQVQAIESEERLGKISAAAAVAQEQTLLDQKWAADQAYYAKKKAAADGDTKTQQQVDNAQLVAYQAYLTQKQRLDEQAATQEKKAAEDMAKPYVDAFDQIGTKFEDTITGLIERTTTWQKAFKSIIDQVLKDFIGMVGKMASGAAGSALGGALRMSGGSGGGGGGAGSNLSLGGVLGSLAGGLFGKIGGGAGSSILGGIASLFGAGGGNQDFSGAVGGAASGGGLFSGIGGLFSGLFGLLGFEHGGIVPSAAGGWSVPSLGSGGTLANLHSNEMVLPANLSNFVQGAAASAAGGIGGGGGPSHTFNMNISAMDGKSVMNAGPAILAAINGALRNGGTLRSS